MSFTAIVTAGKRVMIKTTSPAGKTVMKGIPVTAVAPLSGGYSSELKKNGLAYTELLATTNAIPSITMGTNSMACTNSFEMYGTGPDYTIKGIAVVSAQKKVGLVNQTTSADSSLASYFGPYNPKNGSANLKGTDDSGAKITAKIKKQ
jgi:hypothetical protein